MAITTVVSRDEDDTGTENLKPLAWLDFSIINEDGETALHDTRAFASALAFSGYGVWTDYSEIGDGACSSVVIAEGYRDGLTAIRSENPERDDFNNTVNLDAVQIAVENEADARAIVNALIMSGDTISMKKYRESKYIVTVKQTSGVSLRGEFIEDSETSKEEEN